MTRSFPTISRAMLPGKILSGQWTRSTSTLTWSLPFASMSGVRTRRHVSGGTVLSRMTMLPRRRWGSIDSTEETTVRRAATFRRGSSGVGTQMMNTSAAWTELDATRFLRTPGSRKTTLSSASSIVRTPSLIDRTVSSRMSTPRTWNPARARKMARGRPTWPSPTTAISWSLAARVGMWWALGSELESLRDTSTRRDGG